MRWFVLPCIAVTVFALLGGCAKSDPTFHVARATDASGEAWEVWYDGAWHEVIIDGVRPPVYVRSYILVAGNWYYFAGAIDTTSDGTPEKPVYRLEAWNVVPPVRRAVAPGMPPDTTGFPLLREEDFLSKLDYDKFSLNMSAQWWPWRSRLDRPPREALMPVDSGFVPTSMVADTTFGK